MRLQDIGKIGVLTCLGLAASCGVPVRPVDSAATATAVSFQAGNATATAQAHLPYYAAVPGPDCDSGGASWYQNTNSSPASFVCRADSLLLIYDQRQPSTNGAPSVLFERGSNLPGNYRMQVDAFALTPGACVTAATTHDRTGEFAHGYWFEVCQDGGWQVINTNQGANERSAGHIAPLPALATLMIQVQGMQRTLQLNGQTLTTFQDTHPFLPHFVAVGLDGPVGMRSSLALKNFLFTPL